MENFQLPEWLTISNLVTTVTAVVSVLLLFFKFSSSVKASRANGTAQLTLLDTMANKLSDMKAVANELVIIKTAVAEQAEKVKVFVTNTNALVENLALFMNDCFQYMTNDELAKTRMKVRMDELFLAGKQEVINNLITSNTEIKLNLNDAVTTINELESNLKQAKERIPTKVDKRRTRV